MKRWHVRFSSRFARLAATSVALTFGVSTAVIAREGFDWIDFHTDKTPHVTRELSGGLSFGAAVEFSAQHSENLNLNFADDDDEDDIEVEADLGLLYDNAGAVRAYLEFNLSSEKLGGSGPADRDLILDVNEAYVAIRSEDRNQVLTFGRWLVSDDREWLFDEELDGIHFFHRGPEFAFELMYAREQILQKDLLGRHDDDKPDHFYIRAYSNLPGDGIGSIYGLYQMGRNFGDPDLLWVGGALTGRTENDIKYWAEFAHVRGKENNRDVRGFGLDVGLTKTFKQRRLNPRLTAGIAFGSGDDGSGTDGAFRQTGIQDNSKRFGGRKSIRYYGEVFDPELSNLVVLTLGAGIDWLEDSTVDVMYHYNFQHRTSASIRDSALDQTPSGRSRDLGHEIDVIVAIREFENVEIDFFGGVFFPGSAFGPGRDMAGILGIELSIEF